jgi:hypothetical protein
VAAEFKSAEVRYFWVNTRQFAPPDSSSSEFKPLALFQPCWESRNSYVAFFFTNNQLIRISVRFFSDCADQNQRARAFAASYSIPEITGSTPRHLRRPLSRSTIEVSAGQDASAVDVFKNGSPIPD